MRRDAFTVLSLVLGLVAVAVGAGRAAGGAQRATATAISSVGVGGGPVGSGEPEAAPGHILSLRRGIFEPGGIVPLHHHPGALVLWIEAGELTYIVSEGEAEVTRAGTDETPGPTERFGPGTETVLKPGDAVFEQGVVHVSRNDGGEPVVLWIAALAAADQPFTQYHEATGTPAP